MGERYIGEQPALAEVYSATGVECRFESRCSSRRSDTTLSCTHVRDSPVQKKGPARFLPRIDKSFELLILYICMSDFFLDFSKSLTGTCHLQLSSSQSSQVDERGLSSESQSLVYILEPWICDRRCESYLGLHHEFRER